MKRRNFLASLIALPAGLMAAAKAVPGESALNLDKILAQLYQLKKSRDAVVSSKRTTKDREHWIVDWPALKADGQITVLQASK